jgi:hypothetical protein
MEPLPETQTYANNSATSSPINTPATQLFIERSRAVT